MLKIRGIKTDRIGILAFCMLAFCLATNVAPAKSRSDCERYYLPKFGQPGKDVPWEPTSGKMAAAMLSLAKTTKGDRVYDLGAGDGAIVIAAAKEFGANAVGIEYNKALAILAQCYVEAEGIESRAKVIAGDIFETDFSRATVVTMFLWPEVNMRLRPTLLQMKPGTRVVSHMHDMQEWKWDDSVELEGRHAYLWIIPARVEGTWSLKPAAAGEAFNVTLTQSFQELTGSVGSNGNLLNVAGTQRGAQISLDIGGQRKLNGVVDGNRMTVSLTDRRGATKYVGTRTK